jgi:hypothetical protein
MRVSLISHDHSVFALLSAYFYADFVVVSHRRRVVLR